MGSVTIQRRRAIWRDLLRAYVVTIDGNDVGRLRSGEKRTFSLDPGNHDVRMKIDWCGSETVSVNGSSDTELVCDSNGTALTVLPQIIFSAGEYISLRRA